MFYNKYVDIFVIFDKYIFVCFDIDDVFDLSMEFGICSVFVFFFFENGDKVNIVVGVNLFVLKKVVEEVGEKVKGDVGEVSFLDGRLKI